MNEQLIEQLANLEHDRWSRWMIYMFDNWTEENISRWKWQMITPYAKLPEHSKESDRKEARKTMEIVSPVITQLEADNAALKEELRNCKVGYAEKHDVFFERRMKEIEELTALQRQVDEIARLVEASKEIIEKATSHPNFPMMALVPAIRINNLFEALKASTREVG